MKKKIILFVFNAVLIIAASCNKENRCDCFKNSGSITTESRIIPDFNKIYLEDNINLFITQDTICSLTVEAGKHLLKSIKTEVTDNCLYLKNENKCNWVRSFKNKINVYLKYREIKNIIYYEGSGNIKTTDTLHADYFQLDDWNGSGTIDLTINTKTSWFNLHTGPADLIVKGISGVNYLYSVANGPADLRYLKTGYTFMTNNSTNNCYVNVAKEFEVKIGYVGDVYYTGNPYKITSEISGSGKLIKF